VPETPGNGRDKHDGTVLQMTKDSAQIMNFNPTLDAAEAEALAEELGDRFVKAREAISTFIFGQKNVVDQVLITLLAGGNGLLIGVPGLAKTRLVDTFGTVLGMDTKRIQFTPDLMPGDIVGSEVLEEAEDGRRTFRFIKGPVFCQLLMADEINRASPRTQSALLQAMQERHVTVAGQRYDLPKPFHVLATQNPLEQEGTYPLPEAQLDRFLMQVDVGYPDREAENLMLMRTTVGDEKPPQAVLNPEILMKAQALVRRLPVGEKVVQAILGLVRSGRPRRLGQRHRPQLRGMGTEPARQPGLHARHPRPRPARGPLRAIDRRRDRARPSDSPPPHGA
jgi:MoxR-like ATPase